MGDRVRIRIFWLATAVWLVVWAVQLFRVGIFSDSLDSGPMAMVAIVTFGLFIWAYWWSKDARDEAKAQRVDAR